ncbi:hypothetical protein Plhal703r1_c17g0080061 [Plasmopara halstedii]
MVNEASQACRMSVKLTPQWWRWMRISVRQSQTRCLGKNGAKRIIGGGSAAKMTGELNSQVAEIYCEGAAQWGHQKAPGSLKVGEWIN